MEQEGLATLQVAEEQEVKTLQQKCPCMPSDFTGCNDQGLMKKQ